MKREVYDCDGCGATNIGPSHYVIPLGRRTDAAGSSEMCLRVSAEDVQKTQGFLF